jgi:hypothetical protein
MTSDGGHDSAWMSARSRCASSSTRLKWNIDAGCSSGWYPEIVRQKQDDRPFVRLRRFTEGTSVSLDLFLSSFDGRCAEGCAHRTRPRARVYQFTNAGEEVAVALLTTYADGDEIHLTDATLGAKTVPMMRHRAAGSRKRTRFRGLGLGSRPRPARNLCGRTRSARCPGCGPWRVCRLRGPEPRHPLRSRRGAAATSFVATGERTLELVKQTGILDQTQDPADSGACSIRCYRPARSIGEVSILPADSPLASRSLMPAFVGSTRTGSSRC